MVKQKKQPNYKLKSEILQDGVLFEYYKKVRRCVGYYIYKYDMPSDLVPYSYDTFIFISNYYSSLYINEWNECEKIYNSHRERLKRLKNRIFWLIQKPCVFLTLTFCDGALKNLSPETRRRYVQRCLLSYNAPYVANIDFGKKRGREHYHAILQVDNFDHNSWEFGSVNFERVRDCNDYEKLARYVSKLANHALKETTKRSYLLYSKKFPIIPKNFEKTLDNYFMG